MNKKITTFTHTGLYFLALLGISACSTPKPPEGSQIHFHTRITSTGLKHFQVSIIRPPAQYNRGPQSSQSRSGRSPEERDARDAEKMLVATAELKILETHFCRDGYWFLGNNFYGRNIHLRGECNETATEADRKTFPDTLLYW